LARSCLASRAWLTAKERVQLSARRVEANVLDSETEFLLRDRAAVVRIPCGHVYAERGCMRR
jgi:hypothetical protein